MRRGWKIFWIVCASIAGIGLVLCVTGAGMGATLSGIGEVYAADHWYLWDDWHTRNDSGYEYNDIEDLDKIAAAEENYTQGSDEYVSNFKEIQSIDIEATYVEIDIRTYNGDSVTVDTSQLNSRLRDDLEFGVEDHELWIDTGDHSIWKQIGRHDSGSIVIQIPENTGLTEASFDIGAGLLKIENIKAGELDINVGAGQAVIKDFEAGDLDVECGAGQATLRGKVNESADIHCGVGELKMSLSGNQDNYDYELKCGIGELTVGDYSYAGLGSERNLDNGTGRLMKIDCGIGRVEVKFNGES